MSTSLTQPASSPVFRAGADRREVRRFGAPQVIASGDWEKVVDISLGGACMEAPEGLQGREVPAPGERITVILTDEILFHTAAIEAEVAWRRGPRVGLRWLAVDPPAEGWLREQCRSGGRILARGWIGPRPG